MRSNTIQTLLFLLLCVTQLSFTNDTEPWKPEQLMEPSMLAAQIKDSSARSYIILGIGPGNDIKGSVHIGSTGDKAGLDKLRAYLEKTDRNAVVVLYCGCCPFKNCPNIRPAFKLMNEMGFTRHRLLNIRNNIKTDWIDKGYPVQ